MRKYIIFGAGKIGMEVYSHMKKGEVAFFCDNNPEKVGGEIEGIEIISFVRLLEIYKDYVIILSVGNKYFIRKQFERNGITDYIEYQSDYAKEHNIPNDDPQKVMNKEAHMNQQLDSYLGRCEKIDTLNDFQGFKELVLDCKKYLNGKYAFYESVYGESMLYGYAKALMDYAKIETDYANFPFVAHAPFYAGTHPDFSSAAIFSSAYDKNVHNSSYPYIPVFAVGPYIQYAKSIYDEDVLTEMKKNNGKTAVFFITHSAEQSFVVYDEKRILNQILEIYAKRYDTVLVCAYWCDIDKEIYNELSRNGIKVVSAGFRFDEKFVQRLRTIMDLGDDIFVYGFTSAIIYALSLKKNLFVLNCNESYSSNNLPKYIPVVRMMDKPEYSYVRNILNKFGEEKQLVSEKEKRDIELYFGLNQIKSVEEIRMIYEISCDIWDNCDHLEKSYPFGVYETYRQYPTTYAFEIFSILSHRLARGFWNI